MKNLFTNSKKITICFIIILTMLATTLLSAGLNLLSVKADVSLTYTSTPIEISDGDFEVSSSSSKYPLNLTDWTKTGSDFSNIKKGVIDLSSEKFVEYSNDYGLTTNPGVKPGITGTKVLMINTGENSYDASGFKAPAVTFEANSFYSVSVLVLTDSINGATASVKITGEQFKDKEEASFDLISTNGSWQPYNFYIATDLFASSSVQIELGLGNETHNASSYVLFDNLEVKQISSKDFSLRTSEIVNGSAEFQAKNHILDFTRQNLLPAEVNADFENGTENWTMITNEHTVASDANSIVGVYKVGVGSDFNTTATGAVEPTNAYRLNNEYALLINNKTANVIGYKSSEFAIDRHNYYVLTVQAKTNSSNTSASMKIVQSDPYNNDIFVPAESTLTDITSKEGENLASGEFKTFKFFIKGSYFTNSNVSVELWLGNDSTTQKGYVWFDNLQLFEITSKEYSDYSAEDGAKAIDLNSNITGTPTVTNGYFNDAIKSEVNSNELIPADWTITSTNLANATLVEEVEGKQNVMKLTTKKGLNDANATIIAQSKSLSMAANAYYKITFSAKLEEIKEGGHAFVSLLDDSTVIFSQEIKENNNEWTDYELYVNAGDFATTFTINFNIGKDGYNTTGTVYINDVEFVTSNETVFTHASNKLNLAIENFSSNYDSIYNVRGLKTPTNYTGTNVSEMQSDNINVGIIDVNNYEEDVTNTGILMGTTNPHSNNGHGVLAISLNDFGHYYYQSTKSYSLEADSYYVLKVSLKTVGISHEPIEDEENNKNPYGAYISLPEVEGATIKAIDTLDHVDSNGYKTYNIYIHAGSAEVTPIRVGLGQNDALTKGTLFVDTIELITSNEEDFKANEKVENDKSILTVKIEAEEENTEDEEEIIEPENNVDFNFLLIPTLITSIAIIIAIVGSIIRKYGKLPTKKQKTVAYDKSIVEEAHNLRESLEQKEIELANYEKELEATQKEFDEIGDATEEMTDLEIDKLTAKKIKVQNHINLINDKIRVTKKRINEINKKLGR